MNSQPPYIDKWQRVRLLLSQAPHHTVLPTTSSKAMWWKRVLTENCLVFLLQYSGLMMSTLSSDHAPLWLASGTACAFIFMRGQRLLPGIWFGTFFAYFFANAPLWSAVAAATLLTIQNALLFSICHYYQIPSLIFYHRSAFLKFLCISGLITAGTSGLLLYLQPFSVEPWLHQWLANLTGLLIIACAIVTWDAYFPDILLVKQLNPFSLLLPYGLLLLVTCLPQQTLLLPFTSLIVIFYLSWRFRWCGSISGLFLVAMTIALAQYLNVNLPSHPTFLALESITGLFIAIHDPLR